MIEKLLDSFIFFLVSGLVIFGLCIFAGYHTAVFFEANLTASNPFASCVILSISFIYFFAIVIFAFACIELKDTFCS